MKAAEVISRPLALMTSVASTDINDVSGVIYGRGFKVQRVPHHPLISDISITVGLHFKGFEGISWDSLNFVLVRI